MCICESTILGYTDFIFTETNRGFRRLIHQGYAYNFHSGRGGQNELWRCSVRRKYSCKSACVVSPGGWLIKNSHEHSHPADEEGMRKLIIRAQIRQRALVSDAPAVDILNSVVNDEKEYKVNMKSLERRVRRLRMKHKNKDKGELAENQNNDSGSHNYNFVVGAKVPKGGYEWGQNQRNKRKLVYADYWYNEHIRSTIASKGTSTWRCSHHRQKKCNARLRLLPDESIAILGGHTHPPVRQLYKLKAMRANAKKKKLIKELELMVKEAVN